MIGAGSPAPSHLYILSFVFFEPAVKGVGTHTCISTTNINGGKMMCPDNKTTYAMAQRVADVTGQPTKLVVENVKKVEWECPKTFYPQNEEDED